MPASDELVSRFWKCLERDRTVMLGLDGAEDGHTRPMTAQFDDGQRGPLWFFASRDNEMIAALGVHDRAIVTFASKDHEIFATIQGSLGIDTDRATVDRLWNPHVAAWYEGGKDDPKLVLLRLEAEEAQIWENASSLLAGLKTLLGVDPKRDNADKMATVRLD